MDIEKLLEETFMTHERDAPDGDAVLAATRQRIDRRRNVLSRPLAVAAGVAVLSLAAVTVVALNRTGPADQGQAAAPGTATAPANKAPAKPAVADLKMPFSLGWLPPGKADYIARRINIGGTAADENVPLYGGEYMLTVTAGGIVLDVDVQEFKMVEVDTARFKSGPGRPVTINGQHGIESSVSDGPGGYELYAPHPDQGSMYINVSGHHGGSTPPTQQLIDTGRRIAENIHFPGNSTVTPSFGLRDLPGGLRVCAFGVERALPDSDRKDDRTSYELGTCATVPPIVVGENELNPPAGKPGHPVQGRATRYLDDHGYRTLWVLKAVKGAPVTLAGKVPLSRLYDIANRLVLPH